MYNRVSQKRQINSLGRIFTGNRVANWWGSIARWGTSGFLTDHNFLANWGGLDINRLSPSAVVVVLGWAAIRGTPATVA